jgi:hypothetical protein
MPILITERPPSLYCSLKQINQMHHTCIKNYDLKRLYPKSQIIIQLKENEDGSLTVQYGGTRKTNEPETVNRRALKRDFQAISGKLIDDIDHDSAKDDQLYAQQALVDDTIMADEEHEDYISKFYLG